MIAGIKASLFEDEIVADYLLYRLNIRHWETGGRGEAEILMTSSCEFLNPL